MRVSTSGFALLFVLSLASACTHEKPAALPVDLGDVPYPIVEALATGNDSLLVECCYEYGMHRVLHAAGLLNLTVDYSSPEAYRRSFSAVDPYMERIFRVVANEFHGDHYLFEHVARRAWTYEEALTVEQCEEEAFRIYGDRETSPFKKRLLYEDLVNRLSGFEKGLKARADAFGGIANCLDEQGDIEGELLYRKRALDELLEMGISRHSVHQLAIVGYVYGKLGQPDSLLHYARLARSAAYKLRHPNPVLFILHKLLRPYYIAQGNLALANDLVQETQQKLQEFKGTREELGLGTSLLSVYADWGAWGMFEDCLVRCEALFTLIKPEMEEDLRVKQEADLTVFRALLRMAGGDLKGGDLVFRSLEQSVWHRPYREHYSRFMLQWGRALLRGGDPQGALPVLAKGLEYARNVRLPSEVIRLASAYANALYQAGDHSTAAGVLDLFQDAADEDSWRDEYVNHDMLRIRIALARGDRKAARLRVSEAIARLRRVLSGIDATVQAYLFLDGCQDLREAVHEYLGNDPRLGYGFEMYWRSFQRSLGGGGRGAEFDPSLIEATAGAVADRLTAKLADRDAVHCVYIVGDREVVRWKVSGNDIRREVVSHDRERLEKKLNSVGLWLSGSRQDGTGGGEILRELAKLAKQLLPEDLLDGGDRTEQREVLISGDRFLEGFPFETLNLSGDQNYRPLLGAWNVAYLRYDGDRGNESANGPGLIVADPSVPLELRRRYPSLVPLPHTVAEAKEIQVLTPGSRLLMNSGVTKRALTASWESVPFLVVSAHFVRDPEMPYFTFLPLASETGKSDPDASYLDLTEVRRADLAGCGLVVLSGCATGAPYSDTAVWGPGLGDAFLDAGAGAVIQTFWQVKDLQSRKLMTRWAHEWVGGKSPEEALCDARRAVFAESGLSLSFSWSAYAIELGGL